MRHLHAILTTARSMLAYLWEQATAPRFRTEDLEVELREWWKKQDERRWKGER